MKKSKFYITIITCFVLNFSFSQQKNTINVNGLGKVSAFPNAAILTLDLDHIKPTLREAVTENQKTLLLVKNIIKNYAMNHEKQTHHVGHIGPGYLTWGLSGFKLRVQ